MAQNTPSLSDLIDQLPAKLQNRFESISNYVSGLIAELKIELDFDHTLSREELRLIQFAAFVYSIDDFFRLGTLAAREASSTFVRLNLPGFQVGSSVFTPSNGNTMRGLQLANSLRQSIDNTELSRHVGGARSMRELVRGLLETMQDEV
jgi:hypothetical protein